MPPIVTSTTYCQESPGVHKGFEYSRAQNPTRFTYERSVMTLENGTAAFAFASGMAAINAIFELLPPHSHIITSHDLYGGTYRLLHKIKKRSQNLSVSMVDCNDAKAIEAAITDDTKMIWIESPSNPTLSVIDLKLVSKIAQRHHLIAVCDNTFATPYLQKPLDFGFDIVVHSATKYLNGHSDVINGIVVTNNTEYADQLSLIQFGEGAISSPFDSYMVLRGLKTLAIRMQRHCENALALAQWLEQHSKVKRVIYPGLATHPQHALAQQQMRRFGGMISIELDTDLEGSKKVLENTKLFQLAESLGAVESLIQLPALMTHASIPEAERQKAGISDNLVRLSVGIEHIDDLKADLDQALQYC